MMNHRVMNHFFNFEVKIPKEFLNSSFGLGNEDKIHVKVEKKIWQAQ